MNTSTTVAISHFIKSGKETAFQAALKVVIQEAAQFEGYEGIQIIQPKLQHSNEYLLLVRFANRQSYKNWQASAIIKNWTQELKQYIDRESQVDYLEGLEFWFSLAQTSNPPPPKKWKMATLTWLIVYPLILLLSHLVGIYLAFMPLFLRMLFISITLVGLMTYFLMPNITRIFSKWIFK